MMRMQPFLLAVLLVAGVGPAAHAQSSRGFETESLVGTWTLVSIEQGLDTGQVSRAAGPRGLLVFDRAGHVFELVLRNPPGAGRGAGAPDGGRGTAAPGGGAAAGRGVGGQGTQGTGTWATFSGFWGRYAADAKGRVTYRPEGGASPVLMGAELSRMVERDGDRLLVTSAPDEPHTTGITRWTWERVPPVENLSPTYRQVIGFWQHVVEKRVNLTTNQVLSETKRAPSIIVYTPSGYVGVHFPPLGRERFAATEPTEPEAAAALRGYVGYFGALAVFPNMVFHHVLGGVNFQGTTLKRPLELSGQEVTIKFPPTTDAQGQQTSTWVTLRRLSGAADMMPAGEK
jgi:hypothetical protein